MGAPARAHLRAGAAPGRMRVPDRRAGGSGGAPGDAVQPRRDYSSTWPPSPCLRVDLYTTLDRSDRAIAVGLDYLRHRGHRLVAASDRRGGAARIRADLVASSGAARSRSCIDLPLMSDPASRRDAWMCSPRSCRRRCSPTRICSPSSSAGWSISASSTATATASCYRLCLARHDARAALRRLPGRLSLRPARL